MATRPGEGMNKEKVACCCAILLLAVCALLIGMAQAFPQSGFTRAYHGLFGSVPPEQVEVQAPFTVRPSPPEYRVTVQAPVSDPPEVSRASPFAPPPDRPTGGSRVSEWWRKLRMTVAWTMVRPFPHQPQPNGGELVRPSPLDDTSPAAYMGVLGVSGQRYGMLRVGNRRFLNVREGDELTDLGCTIVRVEKEAIHLLTRKGLYFVLSKNGS